MHLHRRVGTVLMILAVLVILSAPLLSRGWVAEVALIPQLTLLKLQLFCEDFDTDCVIDMQTRYVLIACLILFAVGLLAWLGVFGAARDRTHEEHS